MGNNAQLRNIDILLEAMKDGLNYLKTNKEQQENVKSKL